MPENRKMTNEEVVATCVKWLPACAALLFLLLFPVEVAAQERNGGHYDVLPYRDWGYAYDARNKFESKEKWLDTAPGRHSGLQSRSRGLIERPTEPEYLCFMTGGSSMKIHSLSDWRNMHGRDAPADYVFVSYTSAQFPTREQQYFLHEVGKHAANAAGTAAYWVGCSCLGRSEQEVEGNVWRISDIIRSAHSLVIAVAGHSDPESGSPRELLREWGSRVWTWPEVLLCPGGGAVTIYAMGSSLESRTVIHRRNFPELWDDPHLSGQLVDHYEGSVILSPLELVTTALKCLHNRSTTQYLEGDLSYALMGLLRQRPNVVPTDSAFQAFARLSLSNDSNMLLERLICVLPDSPYDPWHDMSDQWDVSLWDIYPKTQVCGIGDDDTVILDGVRGAAIRWKSFAPVVTLVRDSWKRFFVRLLVRSSTYLFLVGAGLLSGGAALGGGGRSNNSLVGFGAFLLVVSLIVILASPYQIRILYGGKVWGAQPWLFGFEGHMDIGSIERHIFGINLGHLKWSPAGSPLSRHAPNEYGECVGRDPIEDPEVRARVQRALRSSIYDEKIFTLVDTFTMTVTLFSALRPPVAALMCGEEGGMQRTVLCSFDWTNKTLYRETVVRMETPAYEKMDPVRRVRFGLQRKFPRLAAFGTA